ncbi:MAG: hypothetical protein U0872_10510 [Planctomycetaceae bacterium]
MTTPFPSRRAFSPPPATRPFRKFCSTVKCSFRWALMTAAVLAAAGGAGAYWFVTRSNDLLKAELIRQLEERFPDSHFDLAQANFDWSGRVRAYHLQMTLPDDTTPALTVAEMVVTLDRELLAESQVLIQQLRLIKPRARITRLADQSWNWQRLRVQSTEGSVVPDLQLDYGSAVIDFADGRQPPVQCTELKLSAVAVSERGWSMTASGSVDGMAPINLTAEFHLDGRPWKCDADVSGLLIDQSVIAKLLAYRPEWRRELLALNARLARITSSTPDAADMSKRPAGRPVGMRLEPDAIPDLGLQLYTDLKVRLAPAADSSVPQFKAQAQIRNGRISNPVLPLPLHDLTGLLYVDNSQFHVRKLIGHHGKSTVEVHADSSPTEPTAVSVSARQIVIDDPLAARLPPSLGKLIHSMALSGVCDLDAKLVKSGTTWLPDVTLALTGGRMCHEKFPYPVHDVSGTLTWQGDLATLKNVTGQAGTSQMTAEGEIWNPGPEAEMSIIVQARELPIDTTLLAACPDVVRTTVQALNLRGSGDAWVKLIKPAGTGQKITPLIDLRLHDCSVTYERFPLRLEQVDGRVRWNGESATFDDLRGRHAGAQITGFGSFRRDSSPGHLELNLTTVDAPFDADLREALPLHMQETWSEFSPVGRFDVVSKIGWTPGEAVQITLPSLKFKHAEMTLRDFPFPWYNVSGELSYGVNSPDELKVVSLKAEHDDCVLSGTGEGLCGGQQPWQFHFSEFYVDDLPTTHALRRALPPSLRLIFDTLDPGGGISLHGPISFYGPTPQRPAVSIDWNTNIVFSDAEITAGVPIENIHGKVNLQGRWDGTDAVIHRGNLEIGSLKLLDHVITQVLGPFRYQAGVLTAGSPQAVGGALQPASQDIPLDQQVRGSAIDGLLTLNSITDFQHEPDYRTRIRLFGGNLEKYAQTYLHGQTNIRGTMNGWIDLKGRGTDVNRLTGTGHLAIRPAELGELPVVIQVFRTVNPQLLNRADRAVFKEAVFNFQVANERFHFDLINLDGDAVQLVGRGDVRFDGIIGSQGLEFYSTAGRTQRNMPLLGNVVRFMSRGWVGVKVKGDVRQPAC